LGYYSIKDLENLTGVKAHTIRMWEQRYNILQPERTETNIRLYDAEGLKQMLNVALLNQHGYKISHIAQMSNEELRRKVMDTVSQVHNHQDQISGLTVAMIELNEEQFETIIQNNFRESGFEETIVKIIYPFLVRVGMLWTTDSINPAQEHFITNLIRNKIISAIDQLVYKPASNQKKFMLFLPEGELHEIGLLFSHFVVKKRGHKVFYLGQSLPFEDLRTVHQTHQPDYIFTVITSVPGSDAIQNYVDMLSKSFPQTNILLTGLQVVGQDITTARNSTIILSFQNFIDFIDSITSK